MINRAIWLGDKKFGKPEFLATFKLFCNQSFKLKAIHDAFKFTILVFLILM